VFVVIHVGGYQSELCVIVVVRNVRDVRRQ